MYGIAVVSFWVTVVALALALAVPALAFLLLRAVIFEVFGERDPLTGRVKPWARVLRWRG